MNRYTRSMSILLTAAIAAGSMSYELCGSAHVEDGDAHSLRHSHGGYEHLHHHHHHDADPQDADGDHDGDHDGLDHLPLDLKAVWTAPGSKEADAPPVIPVTVCVIATIADSQVTVCRGVPPPRAGPDPTRQLRQIRSIVLLV